MTVLTGLQVQEIVIDYTSCRKATNDSKFEDMPSGLVKSSFKGSQEGCRVTTPQWRGNSTRKTYGDGDPVDTHLCSVQFSIPNDLNPPVLFYYRLTNFYQNHRRYVKSLDSDQLKGEAVAQKDTGACDPLRKEPGTNKTYYPCGLIANSVFNDTFANPIQLNVHNDNAAELEYNMTDSGIAWDSDTKNLYKPTKYKLEDIAPPPNWYLKYQKGYTENNPPPNLQKDEAFQVWMRTAGLPNFSKLAKRNDKEVMQCSKYQVDITDSKLSVFASVSGWNLTRVADFPVDIFGGTKSIVISTRTVIGGKNPFLGIAYIAVGGICIVLGALFTVTHLVKPR